MSRSIQTDRAPAAVGPYSQAIINGDLLFSSGQIPLDPATGKLVVGGIAEQTERVMENLRAVLEAGGSSLNQVCKTTIFLTDLSNFAEVNQVYARYFEADPPARSTLQVAALPLGADIEIEAIARI